MMFKNLIKIKPGTKILWRPKTQKKWRKGKIEECGFFANVPVAGYKIRTKKNQKVDYIPFGSEDVLLRVR